jgi:hypothetical protein
VSHYLQRLSQNLATSGGNVRPLASLRRPAEPIQTADGLPALEENIVVTSRGNPAAVIAPASVPAPPQRQDKNPVPEWLVNSSEVESQPGLTLTTAPAVVPARHSATVASQSETENPREPSLQKPDEAGSKVNQPWREFPPEPSPVSLIMEEITAIQPVHDTRVHPLAAAKPAPDRPGRMAAVKPVFEPANRVDQVEIHIGRIEVTAMPSIPPAIPSAKTRRAAPSLDDYLRRRDRKTL